MSSYAYAQPTPIPKKIYTLFGVIDFSTGNINVAVETFITGTMNTLIGVSTSLAILMLIVSGIQRITAQADEKALKASLERTQFALIGLAIVITAVVIQKLIYQNFFQY